MLKDEGPRKRLFKIGVEFGGPKSRKALWDLKNELYRIEKKYHNNVYFKTVDLLLIVFRISGELHEYHKSIDGKYTRLEGPANLRYWSKDHFIGIDMVIPIKAWKDRTPEQILEYLLVQLRACFDLLVERALEEKEVLDEAKLRADINELLSDYERDCREKFCKSPVH